VWRQVRRLAVTTPEYKPTKLPRELLGQLMRHAVEHLLPPAELIAISTGQRTKEPFLFDATVLPPAGQEQTRFVLVLSHLYQRSPVAFDKAAPTVKGTKRVYFGRTAEEVFSTGSSNTPMRIPGSPWFVTVNNPFDRKAAIVERVMLHMGFSADYASMVASLSYRSKPILPVRYQHLLT
jgi:hypothetical protein